ncbi:hypothetical protein I6A84_18360 [Frankia sp. CNm7]|uniref:Uncharacterized protein n=1 Tax=Frankia nepalensis TaxID=1836974 RepID=A0A937US54_9ACTN|nr:hypothetical protein [Frankia nepalensis]MBL7497399.1 hypothetical protein [Frankia nepalensis]MBL7512102.1 hypothetical protein [Frankia nepalensis]MBL7520003.1 hypothetical protein [Frankia nepalensis]MBL7631798.1 hypothetical protein [Frankia nepalensis]
MGGVVDRPLYQRVLHSAGARAEQPGAKRFAGVSPSAEQPAGEAPLAARPGRGRAVAAARATFHDGH